MPQFCFIENCFSRGYFGYTDDHRRYCKTHRQPGMRLSTGECSHDGCFKRGSYNYIGIKRHPYCGEHKLPNMCSMYKRCQEDGCLTHATYGFTRRREYCFKHKKEGMIYLINRKCSNNSS